MSGWICLHRDFQKHWLFDFKEPDKSLAWIDLLLSANHDYKEFLIKGRVVKCNRGQVAMSQITLQNRWKWSQNKVKRFLELLKKHSMIVFETNDLTTIITICNYDKYQDNERTDERIDERPDERATDDQSNDKQQLNNENKITNISTNVDIRKSSEKIPYQEIVDLYHQTLPMMRKVYTLTDERKKRIKALWLKKELDGVEYWGNYFKFISRSKFLTGSGAPDKSGRIFTADLDFIINPTNYVKISEEKYHEQKAQTIRR